MSQKQKTRFSVWKVLVVAVLSQVLAFALAFVAYKQYKNLCNGLSQSSSSIATVSYFFIGLGGVLALVAFVFAIKQKKTFQALLIFFFLIISSVAAFYTIFYAQGGSHICWSNS